MRIGRASWARWLRPSPPRLASRWPGWAISARLQSAAAPLNVSGKPGAACFPVGNTFFDNGRGRRGKGRDHPVPGPFWSHHICAPTVFSAQKRSCCVMGKKSVSEGRERVWPRAMPCGYKTFDITRTPASAHSYFLLLPISFRTEKNVSASLSAAHESVTISSS